MLSYVDAPSSGDVETSLLVELLRDALMFDAAGVRGDGWRRGCRGCRRAAAASSLVASLAAATDAIGAQGDAEVQLGAAELRAVLARRRRGEEDMGRRGARQPRAEAETRARVHREGGEGRCAGRGGRGPRRRAGGPRRLAGRRRREEERVELFEDRGSREEGSPESGSIHPNDPNDPRAVVSPRPSSPRRRVARWTSRERRTSPRTRAASDSTPSSPAPSPGPSPGRDPGGPGRSNATAEALGTLRAAAETLTRARAPTPTPSPRVARAVTRRAIVSRQEILRAAARRGRGKTESDRLAARVAELRDELARTERKATDAAARAGSPRRSVWSLRRRTARFATRYSQR